MATIVSRGEEFSAYLLQEIFSKVKGKSSVAKLCGADPIPFNGIKEFTFSMDSEIDIVAENGAKGNGGATIGSVTIVPIKVEYGARVSDEFIYASDEEAISILEAWTDGFQKKLAKGLDLMAFHGINPRTGNASQIIGTKHFDSQIPAGNKVVYDSTAPDDNVDAALGKIAEAGYEANGIVIAPTMRDAIAALKVNGARKYPEFAWGATPENLGQMRLDSNITVSANSSADRAIVGDFQNAFKWGMAKDLGLEVIEYGNPDNDATLGDLKGHNQVYLRSEAYLGWGILDPNAFALVAAAAEGATGATGATGANG